MALFTGAVALGSSPILVRISELEPTATAFYRVALAAPAFLMFSLFQGRHPSKLSAHRHELQWLIAAGGFFALDLLCLHWSLRYTSVANATLFLNFAPFFVALGAWAVFRELPARRAVLGFAIAIGGVALLVGGTSSNAPSRMLGDALGVLSGAAYGAYLLAVSRFRQRITTSLVMGVTTLSCALFLLPTALAMGESLMPKTASAWVLLLTLALITHAGGQGLLVFAMKFLPASTSSVTLLLQPVVAACGAWVVFSEDLGYWQIIGGCVVLLGIVLCHSAAPQARNEPAPLATTLSS